MKKGELAQKIAAILGGRAYFNYPTALLTTWKTGGPAWCLAQAGNVKELTSLLRLMREYDIAYMPVGMGSNLLFSDSGFNGVLIALVNGLAKIKIEGCSLCAGAGAKLSAMLRASAKAELSGLEWAAGIPGSLGGAVAMNAGSLGGDMASVVQSVDLLTQDNSALTLSGLPQAGYRSGGLPAGAVVVKATMALQPGTNVKDKITNNLKLKKEKFPLDLPNAGSVFKNPPNDFAARLIEAAGLKGHRCGNAQISTKHANFIVNLGSAKADDILELMRHTQREVALRFGVDLVPEVKLVGHA